MSPALRASAAQSGLFSTPGKGHQRTRASSRSEWAALGDCTARAGPWARGPQPHRGRKQTTSGAGSTLSRAECQTPAQTSGSRVVSGALDALLSTPCMWARPLPSPEPLGGPGPPRCTVPGPAVWVSKITQQGPCLQCYQRTWMVPETTAPVPTCARTEAGPGLSGWDRGRTWTRKTLGKLRRCQGPGDALSCDVGLAGQA